jgi:hypothetical protein
MFATEESLNHGKSSKDTNNSRLPSSNQNPCGEMFVTSTCEVAAPRCPDFIASPFKDFTNDAYFTLGQAVVLCKLKSRFQSEFCLSFTGGHVHVHARFFAREKEESVRIFTENRGTHEPMLPR